MDLRPGCRQEGQRLASGPFRVSHRPAIRWSPVSRLAWDTAPPRETPCMPRSLTRRSPDPVMPRPPRGRPAPAATEPAATVYEFGRTLVDPGTGGHERARAGTSGHERARAGAEKTHNLVVVGSSPTRPTPKNCCAATVFGNLDSVTRALICPLDPSQWCTRGARPKFLGVERVWGISLCLRGIRPEEAWCTPGARTKALGWARRRCVWRCRTVVGRPMSMTVGWVRMCPGKCL